MVHGVHLMHHINDTKIHSQEIAVYMEVGLDGEQLRVTMTIEQFDRSDKSFHNIFKNKILTGFIKQKTLK